VKSRRGWAHRAWRAGRSALGRENVSVRRHVPGVGIAGETLDENDSLVGGSAPEDGPDSVGVVQVSVEELLGVVPHRVAKDTQNVLIHDGISWVEKSGEAACDKQTAMTVMEEYAGQAPAFLQDDKKNNRAGV
jgi:hypothetical protein